MDLLHFYAFYGHDDTRSTLCAIVKQHVVSVHTNDVGRVVITLTSGTYITLQQKHTYDSVLQQLSV